MKYIEAPTLSSCREEIYQKEQLVHNKANLSFAACIVYAYLHRGTKAVRHRQ